MVHGRHTTAIVTGGTGYIGSITADFLAWGTIWRISGLWAVQNST